MNQFLLVLLIVSQATVEGGDDELAMDDLGTSRAASERHHELLELLELLFEVLHAEQVAAEVGGDVDALLRNKHEEDARESWK